MASKKDVETFETLYRKLEETVTALEEGGLTLDESMALYEAGVKLARLSQDLLREAELRVTKLQETFAETPTRLREDDTGYGPEPEEAETEDAPLFE